MSLSRRVSPTTSDLGLWQVEITPKGRRKQHLFSLKSAKPTRPREAQCRDKPTWIIFGGEGSLRDQLLTANRILGALGPEARDLPSLAISELIVREKKKVLGPARTNPDDHVKGAMSK